MVVPVPAPSPQTLSPVLAAPDSSLGRFQTWSQRYLASAPALRSKLVEEGVQLAAARRSEFKSLIVANPREALRQAVPVVVRQQLPDAVVALLEERVEGRAALRVYLSTPLDSSAPVQPPTSRVAEFAGGATYAAYVYGRRTQSVFWVPGASLNGVALDRQLAVNESPLRRLEVGEIPAGGKPAVEVCPVSGKSTLASPPTAPIGGSVVAVEALGEVVYLCDGSHVTLFEEQLIQGEGATGGPQRFTGLLPAAPTPSLGELRVLYIPTTFADQNQIPANETRSYELMREVADFYSKSSFGRVTCMTTVTPPVKLPHNEAWYVQKDLTDGVSKEIDGLGLEHSTAREEARKLGYDANDYDTVVVRLSGGPRAQGVGGYGGGSSVWLYFDSANIAAHEIGHCFGLAHANFWDTGGASAIGPGGNTEYGNPFDVMGGGPFPKNHYNAQAKNQIKWLPSELVQTVTASGTYRVYAFDQPLLDDTKRYALKLAKDTQRTYWGEVRAQYDADNQWIANGLILGWQWPLNGGSNIQLIDTTPASPGIKNDAPIVVGQTFSDLEAGIHFTTIAVNTEAGERSMDVVVNLGSFPGNRAPTLALAASALNIPAGASVTFTASATDPDGDTLAYQWLSSDNTSATTAIIGRNVPTFTRAFASAGQYVVTCVASDMKGGRAIRSLLVSVGNGDARFAISGRVTSGTQGLAGVYVSTGSNNGVPTDSDGYYTIPNLVAGTYTVVPQLFGYTFTDLFNNGVLIGPNYVGANFGADLTPAVTLTASTPTALEAGAVAGKFTLTRTGPNADPLIVKIATPSGSATLTTDYALSPAPVAGTPYLTLTIPAGASSLDVLVTPVNDTAVEGPETVVFELGVDSAYTIAGSASATVTIVDDDTALPKVGIAGSPLDAIENPVRPASFTVTRSGSTAAALTVNLIFAGTATNGADYTALPAAVTIPIGAAAAPVTVSPIDDAISEGFETVIASIVTSAAYIVDPLATTATIRIVDDDQQIVSIAVTDPTAAEVNLTLPGAVPNPGVFVVTRTGEISQPLTVFYALSGTALHGVDFEPLPGSIVLPAGQARASIVITPRFDTLGEPQETVILQLSASANGTYKLGAVSSGTVMIDDAGDLPVAEVIPLTSVREPTTTGYFRLSMRGSTNAFVTVNYAVGGTATSGVDFVALPGSVTFGGGVTAVSAGQYHTLYLKTDGSLWATGYNSNGQLGDGTTTQRTAGVQVATGVSAAAAGGTHSLFLKSDGSVWAVGNNGNGQLADGTTTQRTAPAQVATGAKAVAAGYQHSLVLKADGTLWAFGYNGFGQLGDTTTTQRSAPVQVATGVSAMAAGQYHSLFLKTDGTLWATGYNFYGQLGDGTTTQRNTPVQVATGVSAVAAGQYHSLFLKTDGTLWAMGNNANGQLGDGTGVAQRNAPVPVASGVSAVAAGYKHSLYLKTDATLWTVGYNVNGQLGDGTIVQRNTAAPVATDVTAIAGGGFHSVFLKSGATHWAMGYNGLGSLGDGTTTSQSFPVQIATSFFDIPVVPIDDTLAEDLETVTLTLTPGAGFQTWSPTRSATIWLYDNEQPTVFVDASTSAASGVATLAENSTTPGKFYISRTGSATDALTVNYTMSGTATNGVDYTSLLGSVTIPAGQPGADVLITPTNDTSFEGTETVILTLAPGAYGRPPGASASATIYLTDDETSTTTVAFAQPGSAVAESVGTVNIPVTLSAASASPVTVEYAVLTAGTATSVSSGFTTTMPYWVRIARVGQVFTAARSVNGVTWTTYANPSTIPLVDPVWLGLVVCGQDGTLSSATFDNVTLTPGPLATLSGRDVGFVSTAGSFSVSGGVYTVSGAGTSLGGSADGCFFAATQVTGDFTFTARVLTQVGSSALRYAGIMMREDLRRVARDVAVVQRGANATFYFARTNSAMTTLGLGVDYQFTAGTLTFAPGTTAQNVALVVNDDLLSEVTENVVLTLRNANGAALGVTTQHVLSITDNDTPPLQPSIGFAAAASSAVESDEPVVLVSLSKAMTTPVTVNYAATGGTAVAGQDFTLPAGTLTFAPGETSKALPLVLIDDTTVEGSETLQIALSSPSGATLTTLATHVLTILDNDLPTVSVATTVPTALEGGGAGQWTVARTGSTAAPLVVNFTVAGTAVSGTDFTALGTSLTIPAGSATATLALTPVVDTAIEGDETVVLTLAAGSGYLLGTSTAAVVTIIDANIATLSVVASVPNASETGPTSGAFMISRTGPTTSALTVNFAVTGTATSASDFTVIGTSAVIAAGQGSVTIPVTPIDDAITEGTEYVVLSLNSSASYLVGAASFATVAIADNDNPPTVVVAKPDAKSVQIAAGNGLNLLAVATDDGAPNPLTYAWSRFSGPSVVTFSAPNAAATTATFASPGLYILRISVSDGQFTVFDEVTVRVGTFAAADWIDVSLSAPATRGGSGQIGGVFTVTGSGTGFASTADSAHFVMRPVDGTSSIVARVTGFAVGAAADAAAGVMIRETSYRGARRAWVGIKPGGAVELHTRSAINGSNTLTSGGTTTLPAWFKLERVGDVMTAFRAPEVSGAPGAWLQVGSALTLAALGTTLDAGLAATNATSNTRVNATIDNVTLTPAPSGAATVGEDLGTGALPGSSTLSGSTYTMVGSGTLGDAGYFRFQQFTGDVIVTARILSHTATGLFPPPKGGVMIRDVSLDSAPQGMMSIADYWGGYFIWRNVPGGSMGSNYGGSTANPQWMRIVRQGDTVTAWKAPNTASNTPGAWVQQGATQSFSAGAPIYVGLTVDSGATTTVNNVAIDNYTVVPGNVAPIVDAGAGGTFATATVSINATVTDDGQPNPPSAVTTVWSKISGPGTVTFGNPALVDTTATFSQSGTYVLRLTADDGEASVFADATYSVSIVALPVIASLTPSQQSNAGGSVTLSVTASGTQPFTYQWRQDGTPVAGATSATYSIPSVGINQAGSYTVVVTNAGGSTTSSATLLAVVPTGTLAAQATVGTGYVAGAPLTVTQTLTYPGTASALAWQTLLPTGWTFVSESGSAAQTKPVAGATSLLTWSWTTVPVSPLTFSFKVIVPATQTGSPQIASLVDAALNGPAVRILAQPDPLQIAPATAHSADTDRDFAISLLELTRVIELFNARNGSVRTGAYKVDVNGEDGFGLDGAASGGGTLTRYHSADTTRDGRLSLLELTRVIELFNTRSGTTRSGQYHPQGSTEDGVAPGP